MQKKKKTISFDFNYRANLWTIQEAQQAILTILLYVDYAFCGYKDLQFILNLIVNNSSEDYQLELQTGWQNLMAEFPKLKLLACTKREIISPQDNILTGFLYANNQFYQTTRFIVLHNIIDQIGGGYAALEEALYLTKFVNKVYLVHRRQEFRADDNLLAKAKKNPKIEFILDSVVTKINDQTKFICIEPWNGHQDLWR
ncbi:NAD-binding protein [Spiroplasma mirum]|nr:NAD-binding protein [Spiroplasma mirum]